MKKQIFTTIFALIAMLFVGQSAMAEVWCGHEITNGDNTIYVSYEEVTAGSDYRITITGTGLEGLGGSHVHTYGSDGGAIATQLNTDDVMTVAADGTSIVINLTSASAPQFYTPLYVMMPGEVNFATDAEMNAGEWGTCGEKETVAPVMTSATLVADSETYQGAQITVAATDLDDAGDATIVSKFKVMNGETTVGTFSASEGVITVTGLDAETSYTVTVYAVDNSGNVSATGIDVAFTTTVRTDAPTTSAPTPEEEAANVLSLFSDTYTTGVESMSLNENWGQPSFSTYYQLEVATGDYVAVYPAMTYQGLGFTTVNALTYDYIHIDLWMENDATIQLFPICGGTEYYIDLAVVGGQWNSFDIAVADYIAKGLDMSNMYQFKLNNGGGANVFMDNLYLWREPIADDDAPTGLTVTVDESATTYKSLTLNLYAEDESGTVSYDISYGEGLTATAGGLSGVTTTTTISGLDAATAYTFIVVAYDVNNNRTEAVNSTPAFTAVHPAAPAESAPIPTYADENVMSVYSDTYEQSMGYNVGSWSQSTSVESYTIDEDNIMMLSDFNYLGLEFWTTHDLSNYANLHFDVWAETMTSIQVTPIGGGETLNTYTLEVNEGWNSVDFASTVFTSVDFSQITQMKFAGGSGSDIVYLDNIYYYYKEGDATNVENTTVSTSVVYPNPATDFMIVEAESTIEMVTVYNIMGQTISSTVGGGQSATISVAGLSVGNYIVRVQTADGNVSMHKLIKK